MPSFTGSFTGTPLAVKSGGRDVKIDPRFQSKGDINGSRTFACLGWTYNIECSTLDSMTRLINKDTVLCMSLAGRPGNFGTRFHNFLYGELKLDFIYKAFTTHDLKAAIGGVRALGVRGCAISMPFKEACIELLDELDPSAAAIQSVNTILNTNGHLKGYNTDYLAVSQLLSDRQILPQTTFVLRGSGGMAKAVACALRDAGFHAGTILARNEAAGRELARSCNYEWKPVIGSLRPALLINVTPIGMTGGYEADELAFAPEVVAHAETIFDVVAIPSETPLIRCAKQLGKNVIKGSDVSAIQAVEQFVLYTGIRPSGDLLCRAAEFARSAYPQPK